MRYEVVIVQDPDLGTLAALLDDDGNVVSTGVDE